MRDRPTKQDLRAIYKRTGSVKNTAAHLGIGYETARRWLADAGVELRPKGRPSSTANDLDSNILVSRYQSGETIAMLGAAFRVSPATIRTRLIDSGVTLRPRRGWKY